MSDSLWPHEMQQARPPFPSPNPGVYPSSCSLSQWWYPTISSSVIPFSSSFQSFPASGSFPMSQLFSAGGQSTGISASTSVLPMNTQDWFHLGWTGWISSSLATWCKELTHLKRPWCWERVRAGGEGDDRGWDGWIPLPTQWTWVWVNSESWWWTGRPGILQFMGSQRVGHD